MRRPPSLRRSHSCEAALPWFTGRWPEKRRTAVDQHTVGRKIAGVDLGDRDSFVCVIDGASGEVLERARFVPPWRRMPTKRSPLVLYESLLAAVDGGEERDRVRTLRRLLRKPEVVWPPALREVVAGSGVGVGYLTRGLLSIHRFAPDVRRALAAGLPFAVARLVNGLPSVEARGRALAPLAAVAERGGALLPRAVAASVERLARAERRWFEESGPASAPRLDAAGWVLPDDAVRPPRRAAPTPRGGRRGAGCLVRGGGRCPMAAHSGRRRHRPPLR